MKTVGLALTLGASPVFLVNSEQARLPFSTYISPVTLDSLTSGYTPQL